MDSGTKHFTVRLKHKEQQICFYFWHVDENMMNTHLLDMFGEVPLLQLLEQQALASTYLHLPMKTFTQKKQKLSFLKARDPFLHGLFETGPSQLGETVWNPGTWYFQLLDTPMSPDPSYLTLGILTYSSRWCHVFDSLSNWDGFIQNLWGRFEFLQIQNTSTKIPVSSSLSLDFLKMWKFERMDVYSWRFSLGTTRLKKILV